MCFSNMIIAHMQRIIGRISATGISAIFIHDLKMCLKFSSLFYSIDSQILCMREQSVAVDTLHQTRLVFTGALNYNKNCFVLWNTSKSTACDLTWKYFTDATRCWENLDGIILDILITKRKNNTSNKSVFSGKYYILYIISNPIASE